MNPLYASYSSLIKWKTVIVSLSQLFWGVSEFTYVEALITELGTKCYLSVTYFWFIKSKIKTHFVYFPKYMQK